METHLGHGGPPSLTLEPIQPPATSETNGAANTVSTNATSSPLASVPPTPNPHGSTSHRTAQPSTSPLPQRSPKAVRRASSGMSLDDRPSSSPAALRHKSSRTSLGAHTEDGERRPTPKRSISNLISGLREAQARMESIEEPLALTAPQIAADHFTRELLGHSQDGAAESETMVIIHDACYGHRFSRLKTTKSHLSMIVERPERIHASVLGASAAYVRLGGHHIGGTNAPHPNIRTPGAPAFKIRRTTRALDVTSSYVTNVHGTAWMTELRDLCNLAGERLAAGVKELTRTPSPTQPEKPEFHAGDLYLSAESLNAFQGALGGVADAVDAVFVPGAQTKRAFVAVRPPGHHCSANYPSGFCWLNNVHVGIEYAAQLHGLTHAAILDFDLHHGDGSQAITWERNSKNNAKRLNAKPNSKLKLGPDIGYYSLHDINSYPCEMGDDEKVQAASLCIDNAHGQSIWNVHLQPWKTEKEFWELYETKYRVLLQKARSFLQHHTSRLKEDGRVMPKAALFISAGFDASEWEGAGMQRHKVNVPTEFYARFTRDVVDLAQEADLACDGRVISVLEGGYSDRALCSGVLSHLSGLCATPVDSLKTESSTADSLDQMMNGLGLNGRAGPVTPFRYNKAWWSPANLTALEMRINPPPPPQMKKTRVGQQPTYATPTESFAYKVVDADKFARSISGTMREVPQPARLPTPPLPEVDWIIATQELSKFLIPTDRQTKSCTAEELAGPKIKRDPGNAIPPAAVADAMQPRQLRHRKSKLPLYPESTHSDETESVRSVSQSSSRRQTISELPSSSAIPEPTTGRRASRRLSAGSALSALTSLDTADAPPVPPLPPQAPEPLAFRPLPLEPAGGATLPVKKTRAPTKKEPASSAPGTPRRATKAAPATPAPAHAPPPVPAAAASGELDALTAGMKKVTLKVGTREEHDRKQKERVDAERRARALKAAETRRVNAAAKKAAKESAVSSPVVGSQQAPIRSVGMADGSAIPSFVSTVPAHDAAILPAPAWSGLASLANTSEPAGSNVDTSTPVNGITSNNWGTSNRTLPPTAAISTSQQPPINPPSNDQTPTQEIPTPLFHTPAPPSLAQETQVRTPAPATQPTLHPSTSRPPPRSPEGTPLPVWSSTGMIPFAAAPSNVTSAADSEGRSIWDVPETPRRL
ncbi:histone deacetylase domain-containing protein [Neohortaea acidophila]|uniref:Histone deacetylase domain-containing protein n=1 Tax=Neohortaea acidophila TaxID=245834 RepID=A0A6A6Q0I2_9PEZI|nr:histone deacetylase domain-containing protein [Neohortaea acidophila]KAF2485193.1 histone deacetylase domain-containing protein [Neohortaea acidophila]